MAETMSRQRVMGEALSLLARREYNQTLLKAALHKKFADSALIEDVLVDLVADGYLSDLRYAEVHCRHLVNKHYGPRHIQSVLKSKGVSCDLLSQVMAVYEGQWEQLITRLYHKKYAKRPISNPKDRRSAWDFFTRRGFLPPQIQQVLKDFSTG